jgi:hypothetical protein
MIVSEEKTPTQPFQEEKKNPHQDNAIMTNKTASNLSITRCTQFK